MEPTQADTAPAMDLRSVGLDERGWDVLWVGPRSASAPNTMYRVTIGNRVVEAVAQDEALLIYVNPEAGGLDEWETPPGSGARMWVGTPERLEGTPEKLEVN